MIVVEQDCYVDIVVLVGQVVFVGYQVYVQVWMGLMEVWKVWYQLVGSEGVVGGYLEYFVVLVCVQCGDVGIDCFEVGGYVVEQKLVGVGEYDVSMNVLEQRGCQFFFQVFDLLVDCRLGGFQFFGGSGEVELVGGGFEYLEQVEGQWYEVFFYKLGLFNVFSFMWFIRDFDVLMIDVVLLYNLIVWDKLFDEDFVEYFVYYG